MDKVLVVKKDTGRHKQRTVEIVTADNPKKLSKAGKWLKANPTGLGVTIHDMKAVMK